MPNHCPNWAENRTYLRSLEGTTLGATSAYAQARLEAELCGSDAQRWVHHFVLAYLDPQSPDVDRWLDQPTEAVLSEWQRECVATDR